MGRKVILSAHTRDKTYGCNILPGKEPKIQGIYLICVILRQTYFLQVPPTRNIMLHIKFFRTACLGSNFTGSYKKSVACNCYWCKTNMQILSVTVPAKHQINWINELELTFKWKWNSKQKYITWKVTCKINTTFQNFLHSQKS